MLRCKKMQKICRAVTNFDTPAKHHSCGIVEKEAHRTKVLMPLSDKSILRGLHHA